MGTEPQPHTLRHTKLDQQHLYQIRSFKKRFGRQKRVYEGGVAEERTGIKIRAEK